MDNGKKENQPKPEEVQEAVSYAAGSNGVEGLILTEEELIQINKNVQAGKGEKSFLMAVLQYVQNKKAQQEAIRQEGATFGPRGK